MDVKTAKENILKLVQKYDRIKKEGKLNSFNEAQTRNEFIEPLFEFLGWDMRNIKNDGEVTTEETVSNGRVDLAFRIAGIPKMFLEAKSLKVDLDIGSYSHQAINYAWNKGVTWAILTDFESIKVYNSLAESKRLFDKLVFEIKYTEYISDFERLTLLSKEAFSLNNLDEYAEKYGKKLKKVTVNGKLFKDLKEYREILTHDIGIWNEELDRETLDEGVQRILDRLIFIRVLEDRKLEPPTLLAILHEWEKSDKKKTLFQMLVKKFRELDDIYNSNLFSKHACEEWNDYEGAIAKIIKKLYTKETYEYDFKEIPADILGGVYESYLGYIEDSKEEKGQVKTKRKSQGIYYTPKYIVDYIVQNTLGEKLKDVESVHELKKIKVLDPACGSGPFLTQSLEAINGKYKEFGNRGDQNTKSEILLSNIYGVDLDPQAVELARLNLLIDALDKKAKLPNLAKNVKVGNSLVSGEEKTLRKYFGNVWKEQKPFNWGEEFPEVFKSGNFDVVIGNPPYVSFYSKQSQTNDQTKQLLDYFIHEYEFIENKIKLGRYNTLMFFIEKALKLLKNDGYLGLIIDTNIHSNPSESLRKYISKNYKIIQIIDQVRAFEGVGSSQMVIVIQKAKPSKDHKIVWKELDDQNIAKLVVSAPQSNIRKDNSYNFSAPKDVGISQILERVSKKPKLYEIVGNKNIRTCITFTGKKDSFVMEKPEEPVDYPLLEGSKSLAKPYAPIIYRSYIRYDLKLRDRLNKEYEILAKKDNKRSPMVIGLGDIDSFKAPKIFIRLSDTRVTASFTSEFVCADLSLYILTLPNKRIEYEGYKILYFLAILNSRLITFYMREMGFIRNLITGTPQIRLKDVRNIPIPESSKKEQTEISKRAQLMLDLNKKLQEIPNNSERHSILKQEIEKLDKEIDQVVYKLYGLTEEEIKIVEKEQK